MSKKKMSTGEGSSPQRRKSKYFARYISEQGARALPEYQYSGADNSLLLKYVTNPIYNRMVEHIPLWLAPNSITLIGFIATFTVHVAIMYNCPDLKTEVDDWLYIAHAVATVFYVAMDSIDGKQARRTGSASPLGLLFDHGCDSVNTNVIVLSQIALLQLGTSWWSVAMWLSSVAVFFASTWEEYFTGVLYLPMINGPNEGTMITAIINVATVFSLRPAFWTTPLIDIPAPFNTPYLGLDETLSPNKVFVFLMCLMAIATLFVSFFNVSHALVKAHKEGKSDHSLFVDHLIASTRGVPSTFVFGLFFLWVTTSPSNIFDRYPIACFWFLALLQAKSVIGIMVAHLCDEEYHPMTRTHMAVLALLVYHNVRLFMTPEAVTEFDEEILLVGLLGFASFMILHKVVGLVWEVSLVLGIKPFTIDYPKKND